MRGVILGISLARKRFEELIPEKGGHKFAKTKAK